MKETNMRITFNGKTAEFDLFHKYDMANEIGLNSLYKEKRLIEDTIKVLAEVKDQIWRPAPDDPEGHRTADANYFIYDLIQDWKTKISSIKSDLTLIKRFPIRTYCTLTLPDNTVIGGHSKISKEDADRYMHCRKIGRRTAIGRMLANCKAHGMPVEDIKAIGAALKNLLK
jgi:hypothetical protein